MKPSHLVGAFLLAVSLAAPATATPGPSSTPPVTTGTGGCPAGYTDVANVGSTYVCRRDLHPDVFVSNTHCPAGYGEVGSGEVDKWVCYTT